MSRHLHPSEAALVSRIRLAGAMVPTTSVVESGMVYAVVRTVVEQRLLHRPLIMRRASRVLRRRATDADIDPWIAAWRDAYDALGDPARNPRPIGRDDA